MNEVYDKLMNCYKSVREKTDFVPEAALVLGSGLGDYADHIQVVTEINYSDIEGFPVSTVVGHAGKFIFGYVGKVPVVCMKGRVHYYEGYPVSDVVLPTRLMKLLGENPVPEQCIRWNEPQIPGWGSDDDYRSYWYVCTQSFNWSEYRGTGNKIP